MKSLPKVAARSKPKSNESLLDQARKEWESPEIIAVRKAIAIIQLAEDALYQCQSGLDRESEVAKAIRDASDSLDDILEGGDGMGTCSKADRLDRFLPPDPLGIEALAGAGR